MKKLLITLSLCIYLIIGYELHVTTTHSGKKDQHHHLELHMHYLRESDIEKMLGSFDYLNGIDGEII